MNSGTGRSGKVLRRLLGLSDATSVVSDVVISAVQAKDARRFIETICDERLRFLQSLKTWPVFGKGWGRRIAEVRNGALAMAAGSVAPSAAVTPATGRGEVPVNRKAQGGTVAVVLAAGGSAAHQAQQNGMPLPWVVAVLIATGVIAVAAWWFWRWRQKHLQEN